MEANKRLGADEVIPEEFETSIEIFTRVLSKYLVPKDEIMEFTEEVRSGNYGMFRAVSTNGKDKFHLDIPEINFVSFKIEKDTGEYIEKPLKDLNLRQETGINIVAIKRNGVIFSDIHGMTKIKLGDIVYVVGNQDALNQFETSISIN
jgi:monovalent cation:H+ antiporter-2, CPA2 family